MHAKRKVSAKGVESAHGEELRLLRKVRHIDLKQRRARQRRGKIKIFTHEWEQVEAGAMDLVRLQLGAGPLSAQERRCARSAYAGKRC